MTILTADGFDERLSQITTQWTLLRRIHRSADAAVSARDELMQRYCGAVYRYLRGALRDEDRASDMFQEFALRFLRGDFRGVRQDRGRFRDYVKTVLIHLVNDYNRDQRRQPAPLPLQLAAPLAAADEQFSGSWREELIGQAWKALEQVNRTYHAVLVARVRYPAADSAELSALLSAELGRVFAPGNIRTTLHRARERFADLLVEEVEHSLETPGGDHLLRELKELRLIKLCASALHRRGLLNDPQSQAEAAERPEDEAPQ